MEPSHAGGYTTGVPRTWRPMPTSVDDIEAAALDLPADERARLAQRLFASLDRDPDVAAAWDAEIRQRIDELEAGRMDTIPAEQVFTEARRRLNR